MGNEGLKELHTLWQEAKAKVQEHNIIYQSFVHAEAEAEKAYHEAAAKFFGAEEGK